MALESKYAYMLLLLRTNLINKHFVSYWKTKEYQNASDVIFQTNHEQYSFVV